MKINNFKKKLFISNFSLLFFLFFGTGPACSNDNDTESIIDHYKSYDLLYLPENEPNNFHFCFEANNQEEVSDGFKIILCKSKINDYYSINDNSIKYEVLEERLFYSIDGLKARQNDQMVEITPYMYIPTLKEVPNTGMGFLTTRTTYCFINSIYENGTIAIICSNSGSRTEYTFLKKVEEIVELLRN